MKRWSLLLLLVLVLIPNEARSEQPRAAKCQDQYVTTTTDRGVVEPSPASGCATALDPLRLKVCVQAGLLAVASATN